MDCGVTAGHRLRRSSRLRAAGTGDQSSRTLCRVAPRDHAVPARGADQPQPAFPQSVRAVGVCLVIRRDRLFRDAAIAGELESSAERPAPDFGCAGLPPRTGDLGARLPRPGDPDGLADELSSPPRPLHGKVVENGAGKLVHWPAWTLTVQRAHGLGEL